MITYREVDFHKSPSSDFIWRARARPLTTSSLAAKKGSLQSPRGRLVSSLIVKLLLVLIKQTLWLIRPAEPVMVLNKLYDLSNDRDNLF